MTIPPPASIVVSSPESVRRDIEVLLKADVSSKNPDGDEGATFGLVEHIRKGNANTVLEVIKDNFKYAPPSTQIRVMSLMDRLLINSGPQLAVLLSSEKWTERFFKVAKMTTTVQVRDKIILTTIGWYKRYYTSGHQRLLQRFSQSKVLGAPFRQLMRQYEEKARHGQQQQQQQQQYRDVNNFDNMHDVNPNRVLDNEETFLLQCHGDLASLEYSLEHPQILQDDDIAKECKKHKLACMHMLESGQHERIAPELMSLIEQLAELLELYEAMTGVDLGEGQAAKERAIADEDLAEEDSDDDERQRRVRERANGRRAADPSVVLLEAQQQTAQLMDKERNETKVLRQQLEDLRRKHEELQNKYKDAKAKNKEAVATLEVYASRVDLLEKGGTGGGGGAALISLPTVGGSSGRPAISDAQANRMRSSVLAVRAGIRELREQYCADIVKESQYYGAQISNAMASILQASKMDRLTDQKALAWTQELYKKEMRLRKQYYNTIQELKGNIRVYCRVRPMLPKEREGGYTDIMSYPSTDELKFVDANGRPKLFEFDEVYPPDAPQVKVFEDTSPLIDSVVDGFNVCIFAYGQTGSGKTYTMGGGDGETKGINARALERLFSIIAERTETEVSTVTVSVLEIYCEQIRDLLVSRREAAGTSYEVKQGGPYGTYVTNLTEVPVSSPKEIDKIMERAASHRSEGTTNMNEHSSRSHMILYIIVRTTNKQTNMQSYGKLSLVDLAGSERLDKSGAEGQLMKEAVAINKSLSSLGDVISGLASHAKHIPFRNSTLTFLLQDSMAGQAKVLMFVCVSPASYNASESGSSLLFASRARGIEFGQIKKNAAVEK